MKIREYKVESLKKGIYYCPSCHRQIETPFKGSGTVNIQSSINLMCGNCKKGKIKITVIDKPITIEPSGVEEDLTGVVTT
jgi:uncharacterized CHY-type Zn-finger protein